jgi:hypothetical protein
LRIKSNDLYQPPGSRLRRNQFSASSMSNNAPECRIRIARDLDSTANELATACIKSGTRHNPANMVWQ